MSLRKDLVEHSTRFLPPGSQIRQAFICQTRQSSPSSSSPTSVASQCSGSNIAWWLSPSTPSTCWTAPSHLGCEAKSLLGTLPRHTQLAQSRVDGPTQPSRRAPLGPQALPLRHHHR